MFQLIAIHANLDPLALPTELIYHIIQVSWVLVSCDVSPSFRAITIEIVVKENSRGTDEEEER